MASDHLNVTHDSKWIGEYLFINPLDNVTMSTPIIISKGRLIGGINVTTVHLLTFNKLTSYGKFTGNLLNMTIVVNHSRIAHEAYWPSFRMIPGSASSITSATSS